jgi:hypothetical protein
MQDREALTALRALVARRDGAGLVSKLLPTRGPVTRRS